MLTPPTLAAETIVEHVRAHYGLRLAEVTFLPIGADANAAVFRAEADDGATYFLKLKRGNFDEVAVAVPAFLHTHGIGQVMAALPTRTGRLWTRGHGFVWLLYPFFEGHNGFEVPLTDAQWVALGQCLRQIHSARLPTALDRRVPHEDYAPRWRDIVLEFVRRLATYVACDDPLAREFAAFWLGRRDEIRAMVERAATLAQRLRAQANQFVLCHTDLHAGNVLLGAHGELAIVDWDEAIFAPRERDLMFFGGGVGGIWDSARESELFYAGYGPTTIDPVALAYYRYERIVADLAAYGAQIFGAEGGLEDREIGLRGTMGQFKPGRVVEIAHRTYEQLP